MIIPVELHSCDVVAAYHYGSKVYGVSSPVSDTDIILVTKDLPPSESVKLNNTDYNAYWLNQFQDLIKDHEISMLECLFLPFQHILIPYEFEFTLSLSELRKSISHKASNSWVKAKKKLADGEFYIGKKSLWHSLRILMFSIQIAEHKRIVNYSEANPLWEEIVFSPNNDWEYFKEKYQGLYNSTSTKFKKLAPK